MSGGRWSWMRVAIVAFVGYRTDPGRGERRGPMGTLLDGRGLDAVVEVGRLVQTNWSGYPLTYVGTGQAIAEWLEQLPPHLFRVRGVGAERTQEHPQGIRLVDGEEAQRLAVEGLRGLDPERRIQVDLWEQS